MNHSLTGYLKNLYAQRQTKNPRYSLRSFARDLGIPAASLSRILTGNRKIGLKLAEQLIQNIPADSSLKKTLLLSLSLPTEEGVPNDYKELTEQQVSTMDTWAYTSILELLRTDRKVLTDQKISKLLGLTLNQVGHALHVMQGLELIEQSKSGGWSPKNQRNTASSQRSARNKKIHAEYIQKAVEALNQDPSDTHSTTGVTVAIDPDKIPEAILKIREFRRSLAHFLSSGKKSKVYRLNIQLFSIEKIHPTK